MSLNRRDLAKALGLAGASMFLPNLRAAHAGSTPPKRFLIFYTQHGTLPWLWRPKGTGSNFTLGSLLAPLEPYKKDLILLDGVDFKGLKGPGSKDDLAGCGHARGQASSLTAGIQTQGATAKSGGPSIDYYISDGLKAANGGKPPTAIPLAQAAIVENRPNVQTWGQPYQSSAGQTVLPERDALTLYKRLFPNGTPAMGGMPAGPDKETLQRKAALEYLEKEYKAVESKLGKFEKNRLEQHVTLVSDLKQRIDLMSGGGQSGGPLAACKAPVGVKANKVQSNYYDPLIWENTRPTVPLLMQAAFACDITRVFAIHVEDPPGRLFGGTAGFASTHEMVHGINAGEKTGPIDQTAKMYGEFTKIFKEVLDLLSSVKESDGNSMLYHTCVLWCGELAQPGHSTGNCKWLTAGNLGGYLKPNQVLSYGGDEVRYVDGDKGDAVPSNGDVFTTIANGMGVPTKAFGVNTKGEIAAMKA
jgi:hypothetical protein